MDVLEIVDEKSLEAWLNSLPQGTEAEKAEAQRWAVQIAHRAAMRVLPSFWESNTNSALKRPKADVVFDGIIPVSLLIASLRGGKSSAAFQASSLAVANCFPSIRPSNHEVFFLASIVAATDFQKLHSSDLVETIRWANAIVAWAYARGNDDSIWKAVGKDCHALLTARDALGMPLWPAEKPLADIWAETRLNMLAQGPDWQFWVDWYDKALRGDPQDWDLLTKVALIDPDDWEKGADHVNALIAEIQLKHLAETRPLGEDSIDKGADGLWHRTGRSDIDRDILQDARDSVIDVMDRVRDRLQLTNSLSALAPEIDLLDRALTRYPDRPTRLHDTFLHVQNHIARNLANGELPDVDIVDDLNRVMGTAALDMRNACAKTRQIVEARVEARFAASDPSARTLLVSVTMAAAQISDPDLATEFVEDAQVIDGTLQPIEDEKTLLYRLNTRLAKMVTEDGGNILKALILIGGLGSGYMTLKQLTYFLLSLLL